MFSVAIVWHMHQPPYRNPETGLVEMPWARLHALKDYSKMAIVANRHPEVKLTFNLTPCLLEQIQALADGNSGEEFLRVCREDARALTKPEKALLIRFGTSLNTEKMVRPYPRFTALWGRIGTD